MNKYLWVMISAVVVVLIVVGMVVVKNKPKYVPGVTQIGAECKEYLYNKDASARIIIFASEDVTKKYADYLLSNSPFKENKDKLTILYDDTYTPKCELYKGMAVYCYSSEIEKHAEDCAAEYIIAFDDQPNSIRSSAYQNVASLNINHPVNVVLHEFSHVFGKLEDEYVPAKLTSKNRNCVSTCTKFNELAEGCFKGCSSADYYRPIDSGVMKTLSSNTLGNYEESIIAQHFN